MTKLFGKEMLAEDLERLAKAMKDTMHLPEADGIPEETQVTECEEVAANMRPPRFTRLIEAIEWVRSQMPDETEAVISNVAIALVERQIDKEVSL